jgi:hypothetical protein
MSTQELPYQMIKRNKPQTENEGFPCYSRTHGFGVLVISMLASGSNPDEAVGFF